MPGSRERSQQERCTQGGQKQVCSSADGRELAPVLLRTRRHTVSTRTTVSPPCVRSSHGELARTVMEAEPSEAAVGRWETQAGLKGRVPQPHAQAAGPSLRTSALLFCAAFGCSDQAHPTPSGPPGPATQASVALRSSLTDGPSVTFARLSGPRGPRCPVVRVSGSGGSPVPGHIP